MSGSSSYIPTVWQTGDRISAERLNKIENALEQMSSPPEAGTSTPIMDGTGAPGTSEAYARADHVHPKDTTKQDLLTFDTSPTLDSTNPVTSDGIRKELDILSKSVSSLSGSILTDTASGSIASFTDGADEVPVKSLSVSIDPVQDLHGYAYPWPEGGGKNLLPPYSQSTDTKQGITLTNNDGVYTLNGTSSSLRASFDIPVNLPPGTYTCYMFNPTVNSSVSVYLMSGSPSDGGYAVDQNVRGGTANQTVTFTTENALTAVRITVGGNSVVDNFAFSPMLVSSGVTATSFEPYSNVCPIGGWTGVNTTRTGRNLLPETKWISNSGHIIVFGQNATYTYQQLFLKAGVSYTLHVEGVSVFTLYMRGANDTSSTRLTGAYSDTFTITFTVPESKRYAIYAYKNTATYDPFSSVDDITVCQLELGSTATEYEPYQGDTYNITLPSEAGTVYGGTLDVTSGVLTVDKDIITIDDRSLTYDSSYECFTFYLSGIRRYSSPRITPMLSSEYMCVDDGRALANVPDKSIYASGTGTAVYIKDSSYSDVSDFKSARGDVQIIYPLATPITYQLTPQEVATLLGNNNIWADCGDVDVAYRADTALYIKRFTGSTETDMVADSNIPNNTYFMIGNTLYLSTAAIAAGATIIPGTNCTLTNLAAALNALNT